MNTDLKNYIFHLKNVFSDDFCEGIINTYKDKEWKEHSWQTSYANNLKLHENNELEVLYLGNGLEDKVRQELYFGVMMAIDQYQNLKQIPIGISQVHEFRLNRYKLNAFMREHVDHIYDLFDGSRRGIPVLSIVVNLNEEYSGGSFVFFNEVEYSLKTGDILIFPSNFMYPHKVNPITNGVRYSAVSWAY